MTRDDRSRRRSPARTIPARADLPAARAAHGRLIAGLAAASADAPLKVEMDGTEAPTAAALQLLLSTRVSRDAGAPLTFGQRACAVLGQFGIDETPA